MMIITTKSLNNNNYNIREMIIHENGKNNGFVFRKQIFQAQVAMKQIPTDISRFKTLYLRITFSKTNKIIRRDGRNI